MIAPREYAAAAIAKAHVEAEPGIKAIYRVESLRHEHDEREPIKLLEVNENTVERGIEPISFAPQLDGGIPFPLVIIDVTPREFRLLRQRKLSLPRGWRLGQKILL